MKIKITLLNIYIKYLILIFKLKQRVLGFENANIFLSRIDKRAIIPILRINGATIEKNCDIESGLIFHNSYNYSNLTIGNNCHIGKNCFIDLSSKIQTGNNITISMESKVINHLNVEKGNLIKFYPREYKDIYIQNDVYIGANSTILMGITVSKDSFLASVSIINKDVPPYTLVGGVPAKEIKKLKKIIVNNE